MLHARHIVPLLALLLVVGVLGAMAISHPANSTSSQPAALFAIATSSPDSDYFWENDADEATQRRKLDHRLPEINFASTPFGEVIDQLRNLSGSHILVHWRSLKKLGVTTTSPVTARLKDVKFSKALLVLLNDVAGQTGILTYAYDQGVIQIGPVGQDFDERELKIYDATPFMAGGLNQSDKLINAVIDNIDPESWIERGGADGMIKLQNLKLYIMQTPQNQEAVASLLQVLRENDHSPLGAATHIEP